MPPKQSLLIAGPTHIDTIAGKAERLTGSGIYAAFAARPFVPTQLWSARPEPFPACCASFLERRAIDCAGLGPGPAGGLSEVEPVSADGLGASLIIGLDPDNCLHASQAIAQLPPHLRLWAADGGNWSRDAFLNCAAACDAVICRFDQAARILGSDDPLCCADALIATGTSAVLLTRGAWGGILVYKGKSSTWPAVPKAPRDDLGTHAAFTGALAGFLCEHGKLDYRGLKRGLVHAGAIAAATASAPGLSRLDSLQRPDYTELFTRLRRNAKV